MTIKTVVIHQPDFLPYLGFFHRLIHADTFIVLDDAQFNRASSKTCWHNRDKIKTKTGEQWLTVSVQKAPLGTPINEIRLSDQINWRTNNINLIIENYKQAPYYREIIPHIKEIYADDADLLSSFNLAGIYKLLDLLDIRIEIKMASQLNCSGKGNERLVNILSHERASRYLSGTGARDYFKESPFKDAGIEVVWQNFTHPVYEQCHGYFIPFLSSIDILFNCGINASKKILRQC